MRSCQQVEPRRKNPVEMEIWVLPEYLTLPGLFFDENWLPDAAEIRLHITSSVYCDSHIFLSRRPAHLGSRAQGVVMANGNPSVQTSRLKRK